MKDVTKEVLKTIQEDKIKPTPKWEFQTKEILKMFLFSLNLVIGALGTSIVIFLLRNNEALLDTSYVRSFGQWVILSIPIVWILFTVVGILLSNYFLSKTKDSYKYEIWVLAIVNIVLSLTIGSIIYIFGYTERLNQYFNDSIPMYSTYFDTRVNVWSRPELGYLSGTIIKKEENIAVLDFAGKQWSVDISETNIKGRITLKVGEKIKILGTKTGVDTFKATEIRPWMGGGRNGMQ